MNSSGDQAAITATDTALAHKAQANNIWPTNIADAIHEPSAAPMRTPK